MTPTDVDRTAPVLAHHEIDIAADLATVWDLHTAVNAWPRWHQEITEAALDGPFAVGSSFAWTVNAFPVVSTIYAVEDERRTLWGGTSQGITGIHEYRFDPTPAGVHVTTTESMSGELIDGDPPALRGALDLVLTTWLDRLKQAAEAARR